MGPKQYSFLIKDLFTLPVKINSAYHCPQESMNGTRTSIAVIMNPESIDEFTSGSGSGANVTDLCFERYTGQHCLSALKSLQGCLSGEDNATDIFISGNVDDQSLLEEEIGSLLFSLNLYINPSDECESRIIPFFVSLYLASVVRMVTINQQLLIVQILGTIYVSLSGKEQIFSWNPLDSLLYLTAAVL